MTATASQMAFVIKGHASHSNAQASVSPVLETAQKAIHVSIAMGKLVPAVAQLVNTTATASVTVFAIKGHANHSNVQASAFPALETVQKATPASTSTETSVLVVAQTKPSNAATKHASQAPNTATPSLAVQLPHVACLDRQAAPRTARLMDSDALMDSNDATAPPTLAAPVHPIAMIASARWAPPVADVALAD
jgi:hypothetical protein